MRGGDRERGGGRLVQEFSSGKKEVWIMPGTRQRGSLQDEAKSHDTSHDAENNDSDLLVEYESFLSSTAIVS